MRNLLDPWNRVSFYVMNEVSLCGQRTQMLVSFPILPNQQSQNSQSHSVIQILQTKNGSGMVWPRKIAICPEKILTLGSANSMCSLRMTIRRHTEAIVRNDLSKRVRNMADQCWSIRLLVIWCWKKMEKVQDVVFGSQTFAHSDFRQSVLKETKVGELLLHAKRTNDAHCCSQRDPGSSLLPPERSWYVMTM